MLEQQLVLIFELLDEYKTKIEELDTTTINANQDLLALDTKMTLEFKKLSRQISAHKDELIDADTELEERLNKLLKTIQEAMVDADTAIKEQVESINNKLQDEVRKYVTANINQFRGADGIDGKDGTNGKDGINGVDGKPGKDGKNGLNGKDGLNGFDGRDGVNGRDGKDGKDGKSVDLKEIEKIVADTVAKIKVDNGVDGTGIEDIAVEQDQLVIKLTNGLSKKIAMPKQNVGTYVPPIVKANNRFYNNTEVKISEPVNGEILVYNGTHWVNKSITQSGGDGINIDTVATVTFSDAGDYVLLYRGQDIYKITVANFFEGMNTTAEEFKERAELEGMYKVASTTMYKEFVYSGDSLTSIEVWKTENKLQKLFTKTFSYSDGVLTGYTLLDETTRKRIIRTIVYNGSKINSINSAFTE